MTGFGFSGLPVRLPGSVLSLLLPSLSVPSPDDRLLEADRDHALGGSDVVIKVRDGRRLLRHSRKHGEAHAREECGGFGLAGGRAAGASFIESLEMISHLANVGDAKTLILHPASTTHSQLTDEQMRAGAVSPDMVRISVGLEDLDDILYDLDRALEAAHG